jgi:hypothetical protein
MCRTPAVRTPVVPEAAEGQFAAASTGYKLVATRAPQPFGARRSELAIEPPSAPPTAGWCGIGVRCGPVPLGFEGPS